MKKLTILSIFIALIAFSCSSDDNEEITQAMITPTVGLGDITFNDDGNKVMEIHGAYGHLTSVGSFNKTHFVMWYDKGLGFQLEYVDTGSLSLQEIADMSSDLIDLDQKVIQMVIMSPFEASTPEGVGIGSSREEIVSAYGEPDSTGTLYETYDGLNMNFWYNSDGNVNRIDMLPSE